MVATRARIVEAAVALHETVGPLGTTISAIAEGAGVERLTVYRHFPDEPTLFQACTEHYFRLHPPPDLDAWKRMADPGDRLGRGLLELYRYWRETQGMTSSILRDAEAAPDRVGEGLSKFRSSVVATLARGWSARGNARRFLLASLSVATDFYTWRSLVEGTGLRDGEAASLMAGFVTRAVDQRPPQK